MTGGGGVLYRRTHDEGDVITAIAMLVVRPVKADSVRHRCMAGHVG